MSKWLNFYQKAKQNSWFRYFTVSTRIALAMGFLPSGFVKIMGERFTSLSVNHPMGAYLESLHHTGYYYTVIGVAQVLAAILLLIPRTALLGVFLYFPIILNIAILSHAVRFEGSLMTSPLMVLACIYLFLWDFDRIKNILPLYTEKKEKATDRRFPFAFFAFVFGVFVLVIFTFTHIYEIMPRNTMPDCSVQCQNAENPQACQSFCDCIHIDGKPLDECLKRFQLQKTP